MQRKRVAVVGSGCAGIGAVWALRRTDHDVHLFEADTRLGGHTNTVPWQFDGLRTPVDTGFFVMNVPTYPNFTAFLKHLGVPTVETSMTFGVSRDNGAFEWAGTNLSTIFAQRKNLLSPRYWRMLFDIVRFNLFALDILATTPEHIDEPSGKVPAGSSSDESGEESIGAYLDREGYSEAFRNDYLIPMTACVWSTSPDKCSLNFPARTLVRFLWNHQLLQTLTPRTPWRTIPGGSQAYIKNALQGFPESHVHLGQGVEALRVRDDRRIVLELRDGVTSVFDHVILAAHGDQCMEIMRHAAQPAERAILSNFKTSRNVAVLHNDTTLMPRNRTAWSSWNYLTTSDAEAIKSVCLTYWMNQLQHISTEKFGPVLVTLNPIQAPDPKSVQGEYTYEHPLYTAAAVRAQSMLPSIQNTRGISYAGAWTKYGFHEDGFSSGIRVAMDHLGAELPFPFVDSTYARGRVPAASLPDLFARALIRMVHLILVICESLLGLRLISPPRKKQKIG